MAIINFSVAKPLEKRIENTINKFGFASKAEFFRFSAIYFMNMLDEVYFDEDEEMRLLSHRISKTAHDLYGGKKLPSLEDQLSDLRS